MQLEDIVVIWCLPADREQVVRAIEGVCLPPDVSLAIPVVADGDHP